VYVFASATVNEGKTRGRDRPAPAGRL